MRPMKGYDDLSQARVFDHLKKKFQNKNLKSKVLTKMKAFSVFSHMLRLRLYSKKKYSHFRMASLVQLQTFYLEENCLSYIQRHNDILQTLANED